MTPYFPWNNLEKIFLDMDGVLLDRHFDDWFWHEFVPHHFVKKHGGTLKQAQARLFAAYKEVETTLAWYSPDYWSEQLELDIFALKKEAEGRIALRPKAVDFLEEMKNKGLPVFLVTNAHPKTLAVKLGKFDLHPWLADVISSCTIGLAKENPKFWHALHNHIPYNRDRTFFADDTERVLIAAEKTGPEHLLHIAMPSSQEDAVFSHRFPSVSLLIDVLPDIAQTAL